MGCWHFLYMSSISGVFVPLFIRFLFFFFLCKKHQDWKRKWDIIYIFFSLDFSCFLVFGVWFFLCVQREKLIISWKKKSEFIPIFLQDLLVYYVVHPKHRKQIKNSVNPGSILLFRVTFVFFCHPSGLCFNVSLTSYLIS